MKLQISLSHLTLLFGVLFNLQLSRNFIIVPDILEAFEDYLSFFDPDISNLKLPDLLAL